MAELHNSVQAGLPQAQAYPTATPAFQNLVPELGLVEPD